VHHGDVCDVRAVSAMGKRLFFGASFVWIALPLAAACGSHVETGGKGGSGTITLPCHEPTVRYPPVRNGCGKAADCTIAVVTIDCCGSRAAVGINVNDVPLLEEAETKCARAARCDCNQNPTRADDGESADLGAIQVACDTGVCRTFVP
jgi:hypothetical protein